MLPKTANGAPRSWFCTFKGLLVFAAVQGALAIVFVVLGNLAVALYMAALCLISLSVYAISARTSRR